jgi:hypothetical protein
MCDLRQQGGVLAAACFQLYYSISTEIVFWASKGIKGSRDRGGCV